MAKGVEQGSYNLFVSKKYLKTVRNQISSTVLGESGDRQDGFRSFIACCVGACVHMYKLTKDTWALIT